MPPTTENKFAAIARQHRERQSPGGEAPAELTPHPEYSAPNNSQEKSPPREFGPSPAGRRSNSNYTQKSYWVRRDIHRAFKLLCELQGTDMSSEIEEMLIGFLRERTGAAPAEDPVQIVIANLIRFSVE